MISSKKVEIPEGLLKRARNGTAVDAVIVGADRPAVLESTQSAFDAGLINPVLIGHADRIRELAAASQMPMNGVEVIHAEGDEDLAAAGALRSSSGDVEMVVKGHVHTDAFMAALMKPGAGIRQSGRRMTHCFHMTVPGNERPLIITDGAVNIAPDQTTKKAAILNAVDLAKAAGVAHPKVAILSATESALPQMPSSTDAADLTQWAADGVDGADVFGPLAFDIAVSAAAAQLKGIDSPVAGQADVLLVPNIETGNALFKMMVHFLSACAAGVVVGGRMPIVLTSRADPPEARLASIALAKLVSSSKEP
jgi:phosphate acetyltransferase